MSDNSQFEDAIFRYRSIDALLGDFAELEKQTIYFAQPEQLNDPMEGTRQMYWRGDQITWRNLLRHYIICLQHRMIEALLTEDGDTLNPDGIEVFQTLDNQPTPSANSLCERCIASVERDELHSALLSLLANANRDISFLELESLLRKVHLEWVFAIQRAFAEHGLVNPKDSVDRSNRDLAAILRKFETVMPQVREEISDDGIEAIHSIQQSMGEQTSLLAAVQHADDLKPKRESLFFEFTAQYLKCLAKLVYPPWSVACFSARHDDAAMWSYYAGNHQGCCLVFRTSTSSNGRTIRLNGPNGYGSKGITRHTLDMPLQAVQYASDVQRIEFFKNIGRLPFDDLVRNWFRDQEGNTSPLADHFDDDKEEEWRNAYWERFTPPLLRKLFDWKHEQEYRVILSDILGIRDSVEGRVFTYDYDTLDGIIFGVNTPMSAKAKIIKIIEPKLENRTVSRPFKLYQARYNSSSGKIVADHLFMLKWGNKSS